MSYAAKADFAGPDDAKTGASRRRAILASAIGNFFELFDFTIYGYFAVAISRAFYPSGSMYGTYAAFAAAFVMRPVGAIVIGAYGDRFGRRAALVITIGLMAAATGLTGLIPTYRSIGIWAPVALIVCRLAQGFSTGGEWGGAATFLVEYAPTGRRGLIGSLQQVSTQIGALTGALSAAVLASILSQQDFYSWGWRLPFVFGFVLGPIGYYLRRKVAETPAFVHIAKKHAILRSPLATAWREYRRSMLQAFGLSIIGCIANFIFVIYLVSYMINTMKLPPGSTLSCAVVAGVIIVTLIPFVGHFSDRIGRRPMMLTCALLNLVFAYPLFLLAIRGGTFGALLLVLVFHALFQVFSTGVIAPILAEMFPTRVRFTALSVSYGFAVVLFGGFGPLIATWLVSVTGNPLAPAFYVITGAAISAIAVLSMKENLDTPLD
jgi:MFS transporter, MHS family, proline/betaine transporter